MTERQINSTGTVASEKRRGFTTSYEYDGLDRIRWVKPPVGHWHETRYDNQNGSWVETRRSDGGSTTAWTRSTLDGFGRAIATLNSLGVRTRTTFDVFGRERYESRPYDRFYYSYNTLGRLTRVDQAEGEARQWLYYPAKDLLHQDIQPESGTTTYTYDSAGRLDTKVDANGTSFTHGYDTTIA